MTLLIDATRTEQILAKFPELISPGIQVRRTSPRGQGQGLCDLNDLWLFGVKERWNHQSNI